MSDLTAPHLVLARLADIEQDIASRQGAYETAADDLARVRREWDLRMARALLGAEGSNQAAREASALLAIVAADDDLYERLTNAEAMHGALKVAINTLTERATIGMGILKAQTQQAFSMRSAA